MRGDDEAPVAPLQPGDPRQLGEWVLAGRLGAGGMGVVFLGERGGQSAAVKVIAPGLAGDREFMARFRREIAIGSRVTGPRVAEIYDAEPDAPQPWLAMRFVEGPTLAEAVVAHGPLEGEALEAFAAALADALSELHAVGVMHRDLKPTNVILTADTPVLIDLGIASALDATTITSTTSAIGSAGWMAPEQLTDDGATAASDIYGWGAVVAYAATGRPPFGAGRPEALAYRVVHGSPDLEGVPESLLTLVSRAMSHDPSQRPSADALLGEVASDSNDIAATIRDQWDTIPPTLLAVAPQPPPSAEDSPLPGRAGRRWAVLAGVVLLVALIGGAVVWLSQDGRDGPEEVAVVSSEVAPSMSATSVSSSTTSTSAPPPTSTTAAPTRPSLTAAISPLGTDVDEFVDFAAAHQQEVVVLDVSFDPGTDPAAFDADVDSGYVFVCSEMDQLGLCSGGAEILIKDLDAVTDASLALEHGVYRLRGTYAVQAVSGPRFGIMSVALRAVPIA